MIRFRKFILASGMLTAASWLLISVMASGQSATSLAGKWEGSVLDPRRPYFLTAAFTQDANGAWTGTISAVGNNDLPLEEVSVAGNKVSFKMQLRQGKPAFEGELHGDEIAGKVTFRAGPTDFRLNRLPELKVPKDRVEAWQQDIDTALRFTRYDRSFTPTAREEYRKRLEALKARVSRMNDHQLLAELAKAVALGGNAHTALGMGRSTIGRPPFPLRLFWFADGLYVVRAAPAHAQAVGCRVTAVDGRATPDVKRSLTQLFAGNESWATSRSSTTFVRPEMLYGLGVTKELERATYSLVCPSGKLELQVATSAGTGAMAAPASESDWQGVWKKDADRPRYLRHREKNYWFEYLPERQLLYFQFNSSLNGGEETIPQFGERLLKDLDEKPVRGVVVDSRFNGGGNLDIAEGFIEKLRTSPKVQGKNKLFVITSGATFSAAIFHASQLRANADAVFVGEPVGDYLEFWAEGDSHVLPNSRLVLRSSNGYHSYSKKDPPEFRPYYRDLNIATLDPDIPVRATYKQYASGRDVALEAVLARLK